MIEALVCFCVLVAYAGALLWVAEREANITPARVAELRRRLAKADPDATIPMQGSQS